MFIVSLGRDNDGSLGRWLTILFATVCCLIVIVCSNVGGLLLVRSRERRLDLAVRLAMGASRVRIASQVWIEVLLLAAAGGVLGILLSSLGTSLIDTFGPVGTLRMDGAAISFAVALAAITGIVCGAYPVWSAVKLTPIGAVAAGVRVTGRSLWQRVFVIAQIGTATTLMITGALLIQSLTRVLETPLGFDPRNVTALQISLPPQRYVTKESQTAFWQEFYARASAVPGVESVADGPLPFGYGENVNFFEIVGRPKLAEDAAALINSVTPRYFETLRIPLFRGRFLDAHDAVTGQSVMIDESLASRYFPGEDPIGKKIKVPWGVYTIVGVAGSVKVASVVDPPHPTLYFAAQAHADFGVAIRTVSNASGVVNAVRAVVSSIDKDQPIYDVRPMEAMVERTVRTRRTVVWLMGIFASAGTV
jgi:putative ABC transport system permease protein